MANSKAFHSDLKFVCVLPLLRTHVSWYAHPRSVLELLIIIMFNYFGYMYNLFLDSDNFQTLFRPLCKTPLVLTGFQPSGLITSVWSKLQAFWLLLIDFVTLWWVNLTCLFINFRFRNRSELIGLANSSTHPPLIWLSVYSDDIFNIHLRAYRKDMPRSILCQYPILMSLSSLQVIHLTLIVFKLAWVELWIWFWLWLMLKMFLWGFFCGANF